MPAHFVITIWRAHGDSGSSVQFPAIGTPVQHPVTTGLVTADVISVCPPSMTSSCDAHARLI